MGRRVAGTLEEGLIRVPRSRDERVAGIRSDASYVFSLIEADKDTEGSGTRGLLLDENGIRLYDGAGSTLQFTAIVRPPAEVERTILDQKQFGNKATLDATDARDLSVGLKNAAGAVDRSTAG